MVFLALKVILRTGDAEGVCMPGVQEGWTREYIEKIVAEEEAKQKSSSGRIEYKYNTEVKPRKQQFEGM
jgi:hypothetical protein